MEGNFKMRDAFAALDEKLGFIMRELNSNLALFNDQELVGHLIDKIVEAKNISNDIQYNYFEMHPEEKLDDDGPSLK